ncbi:MAG: HRDC domain-containing protein [Candidatus Hydrogenedentes bacterium]|nr:HRDC domain-containing protein [Candidatus Hydrogenedentota bacterium]
MSDTYELIADQDSWERCHAALRAAPRFAVDLEANSLHAYREEICLIQLSTETQDYILDPLSGVDWSALGGLLADPAIEKVFHASDYDLTLLKSLHGWDVRHLFDTMWAGRVLGFEKMGLASVLKEVLGVELTKKYQKADWGRRPLTPEQLDYARNDTHYLLPLRDALEERLREMGCLEEIREIFEAECHSDAVTRAYDPESFWHARGVRDLSPRALAIFRALHHFREEEAKRRNVPPFKVVNDQMLMKIAGRAAECEGIVAEVPGVSDKLLDRLGHRLQRAVEQGRRAPVPKPPKRPPRPNSSPGFLLRYEALLEWRKKTARARGVESDVILSRSTVVELAEKNPRGMAELGRIESLGPYRRDRYAGEILKVLEEA